MRLVPHIARATALSLLAVPAILMPAIPAAAQTFTSGTVAEIDIAVPPPGIDLSGQSLVFVHRVDAPATAPQGPPPEVRLRLSGIVLPGGGDFRIEIADAGGRVHDLFGPEDLGGPGPVWTGIVPGDSAILRIFGPGAAGLSFRIDRISYALDGFALESIFGQNELIDVAAYDGPFSDSVTDVESAVAKLQFFRAADTDNCTAFRIAEDLVMTNNHCVSDAETCAGAILVFGYRKTRTGAIDFGHQSRCTGVVATDPQDALDVSVLRIAPAPGPDVAVAHLSGASPAAGAPLFIVQHPGGEPKKLSAVECARLDTEATAADPRAFGHSCDTKGGSSGSPVFDAAGMVVGQHRAGHTVAGLTTRPSKGTPGDALAVWLAPVLAAEGGRPDSAEAVDAPPPPVAIEAPETGIVDGTDTRSDLDRMREGAVPLPLPTVTGDVPAAETVPPDFDGTDNGVSGQGSMGDDVPSVE